MQGLSTERKGQKGALKTWGDLSVMSSVEEITQLSADTTQTRCTTMFNSKRVSPHRQLQEEHSP